MINTTTRTAEPPSPTPFGSWRDMNNLSAPQAGGKILHQDSANSMSGQGTLTYATPIATPVAGPSNTPYMTPSPAGASPAASSAFLADANPHVPPSATTPSPLGQQVFPSTGSDTSQTTQSASERLQERPQSDIKFVYQPAVSVMVHEDSGTRFASQAPDMVELPPVYTRG